MVSHCGFQLINSSTFPVLFQYCSEQPDAVGWLVHVKWLAFAYYGLSLRRNQHSFGRKACNAGDGSWSWKIKRASEYEDKPVELCDSSICIHHGVRRETTCGSNLTDFLEGWQVLHVSLRFLWFHFVLSRDLFFFVCKGWSVGVLGWPDWVLSGMGWDVEGYMCILPVLKESVSDGITKTVPNELTRVTSRLDPS